MRWDVVAFDNYGTLEDIHTDEEKDTVWEGFARWLLLHGAAWEPRRLRAAYRSQITRQRRRLARERGLAETEIEVDLSPVFARLLALGGAAADERTVAEAAMAFRALTIERIGLYAGTIGMLRALRQAGLKVALFSNAQILFTEPEMKALGTWDLFDERFISSRYGVKKPSPAFYRELIDWAGVPPEKILMVGNSPRDDILPAKALGLGTGYVWSELTEKEAARPESDLYLSAPDMPALTRLILS